MMFLLNPPTDDALASELVWEKSIGHERVRRRNGRPVRYAISDASKSFKRSIRGKGTRLKERRLIHAFVAPGPILDLGCGDGRTVVDLGDSFVPFGVEISEGLAAEAQAAFGRRGGRVERSPAFEGLATFDDNMFTGAILRAYLEHETRPLPVLERLMTKVRVGGRVIIKVPNFASWNRVAFGHRWCGMRFPDHVNYFTPATFRQLVEKAGFEVVAFGLRMRQPTSDNMWLVAARPVAAPVH